MREDRSSGSRDMLADRQAHTDRQIDRNTPLPYRGGVIIPITVTAQTNDNDVSALDVDVGASSTTAGTFTVQRLLRCCLRRRRGCPATAAASDMATITFGCTVLANEQC